MYKYFIVVNTYNCNEQKIYLVSLVTLERYDCIKANESPCIQCSHIVIRTDIKHFRSAWATNNRKGSICFQTNRSCNK